MVLLEGCLHSGNLLESSYSYTSPLREDSRHAGRCLCVVNGVFWLDGHNLGHGGRIVFRRHRALRGRSGARLQRVTLFTRPWRVRQKLDN